MTWYSVVAGALIAFVFWDYLAWRKRILMDRLINAQSRQADALHNLVHVLRDRLVWDQARANAQDKADRAKPVEYIADNESIAPAARELIAKLKRP